MPTVSRCVASTCTGKLVQQFPAAPPRCLGLCVLRMLSHAYNYDISCSTALQDIAAMFNIPGFDFVKMDVEGEPALVLY